MGTIAEKLSYLADTKDLFKDRLNSLGAEILSTTTFRNYLNWLDTFYNQSSDKTDLSINGIVGRTSQDGDPTPENPVEINNLSGDVEYKVSGKNLFDGVFRQGNQQNNWNTSRIFSNKNDWKVNVGDKFTFSTNLDLTTFDYSFYIMQYPYLSVSSNTMLYTSNYQATNTFTINCEYEGYLGFTIRKKNESNIKPSDVSNYWFQIEKGNQATTYEPYISESFPLSLKSKNLFDKNNANVLNGMFINASARNIGSNANTTSIYIPINPNTAYCVSKTKGNRFAIAYSSTTPAVNVSLTNIVDDRAKTSLTSTSSSDSKYLVIYISLSDTETLQEILDSIMINEGSTATTYEPYYDIELCKIGTYQDYIYKDNGSWYLHKEIGKVVLDGSRNWTKSGNTNIDRFVLSGYVDYGDTNCFSNYFENETYSDSNYNKSKIFLNTYSNTKRLIINFNTVGTTSLSNFKTWLSTHNTVVYYVLATPTTTEITQENYPTLYSQLLAIQEFLTKYKINKEFLLDYSSPEIEY